MWVAIRGVSYSREDAQPGGRATYSSRLRGTKRSSSVTGGARILSSEDGPVAGSVFSLRAVVGIGRFR
jgi:hypothetical protein